MSKEKKKMPEYTVVIDLEMCWVNKKVYVDYGKRSVRVKREIIQIGAVLLDRHSNFNRRFSRYVRPEYGKLNESVSKLTGITEKDLSGASSFADVMSEFAGWLPYGKLTAVSWGPNDRQQLKDECRLKHIKTEGRLAALFSTWIDLQAEYGSLTGYGGKMSLEDAVHVSGIKPRGQFHSAVNDAVNTAKLYQMFIRKQNLVVDEQLFDEIRKKEEQRRRSIEGQKRARERRERDAKELEQEQEEEKMMKFLSGLPYGEQIWYITNCYLDSD